MQKRQLDRAQYFQELAITSEKHFLPYILKFKKIVPGLNILEIGCGDGGNLLPFAKMQCNVTGVDMAEVRIKDAIRFFRETGEKAKFIASDIFKLKELEHEFDIIICHDVIEHIDNKQQFLTDLQRYVKADGLIFMSFPAWQMPFGGHQQICRNKIISHLPFIHLFPRFIYKAILKCGKESEACIRELLSIKETRISIEHFQSLAQKVDAKVLNREFYFINPHYETKFGLKPRKLYPMISSVRYLRNFFTTSCFYMIYF